MSIVHLHLMLNHVPVIGAVFGILLLAVAYLRRSTELAKVTFGLLALLGAVSVAVYLTGEPAEDVVEKLPGFSKRIVEAHEEAALAATIVMGGLGVLALGALAFFQRRALPRSIIATGLVLALGAGGVMGYTAYLGGQVRHTEIRAGAVAASDRGAAARAAAERDEH